MSKTLKNDKHVNCFGQGFKCSCETFSVGLFVYTKFKARLGGRHFTSFIYSLFISLACTFLRHTGRW